MNPNETCCDMLLHDFCAVPARVFTAQTCQINENNENEPRELLKSVWATLRKKQINKNNNIDTYDLRHTCSLVGSMPERTNCPTQPGGHGSRVHPPVSGPGRIPIAMNVKKHEETKCTNTHTHTPLAQAQSTAKHCQTTCQTLLGHAMADSEILIHRPHSPATPDTPRRPTRPRLESSISASSL